MFTKFLMAFVSALVGFGVACRAAVDMVDLPAMTIDTVGVATSFQPDVWGNAPDVAVLEKHIRDSMGRSMTRAQLDVFRQLLLTDTGGVLSLDNANGVFLRARLNALIQQGLFEDVLTLLGRIPEQLQTDEMKRLKALSLFSLGQVKEACGDKMMTAFTGAESAFIRAACIRETGTEAEAALAFDVYREGESFDFAPGTAAGDKLYRGLNTKMPDNGVPTVWELPLVAAAYGDGVFVRPLSRGLLRALALNPRIPPAVRVQAAEKAFLSATDWADVLSTPVAFGDKDAGAVRRAGLYQAAMAAKTEDDRIKAVHEYVTSAEADGVLLSVAPIIVEAAFLIPVTEKTVNLAPAMIRVFALNGEAAKATEWYDLWRAKDGAGALRAAVIMHALGGGVPETIDSLVTLCIKNETCARDLRGIPFFFPVSGEVAVRVPAGVSAGYPAFVTASVQNDIQQGKTGIGLLKGLALLSASTDVERPLVDVLGTALPTGMGNVLMMERLAGL